MQVLPGLRDSSLCAPHACFMPFEGSKTPVRSAQTQVFVLLILPLCKEVQVRGLQTHGDQQPRAEQLAGLVAGVLDRLLERAARLPRNYILDQTKCALSINSVGWAREHARAGASWSLNL